MGVQVMPDAAHPWLQRLDTRFIGHVAVSRSAGVAAIAPAR
jgi:hypothetical protein